MATSESTDALQKTEFLQARTTTKTKRLIQKAADLEGRSLTDFMLDHLQGAAVRIIREHESMALSLSDSELFVEAMLNPPEPNQKLKAAMRWYQEVESAS